MERRAWLAAVGSVVGVLVVANVVSNLVLTDAWYVPWNLAVAVAVVLVGRRMVDLPTMGFGAWGRGVAWGLVLATFTTAGLLLAVHMPVFADLYRDRRVEPGVATMLYHSLVRIPFGTVVLEEVAFRAVLPAVLAVRWGVMRGAAAASALFGLWHVLPAWDLNEVNPTASDVFGGGPAGVALAVLFAVASTWLVGVWWCWIRYRARSVLATVIAHVGTNSVAYAVAWFVTRPA